MSVASYIVQHNVSWIEASHYAQHCIVVYTLCEQKRILYWVPLEWQASFVER